MGAKLRRRVTYANVMATMAECIALGGASYAAFKLPKNSVGPRQLKKKAVTTVKIRNEAVTAAKVKKGTLTGAQVNASTLGTVPLAQTANSLAAPEAWHEVGAPGEPSFQNGWKDPPPSEELIEPGSVAFYKGREGMVHLRGAAVSGSAGQPIFQLPAGYRPGTGSSGPVEAIRAGSAGARM